MYELLIAEGNDLVSIRFYNKQRALEAFKEKSWELSAHGRGNWELDLLRNTVTGNSKVVKTDSKDIRRMQRAMVQAALVC